MPVIKISFSQEQIVDLIKKSNENKMTIQDYIRYKVLNLEVDYFNPKDAVEKAFRKYEKGDVFTLQELMEEEWKTKRGAMNAGRIFQKFINENNVGIDPLPTKNKNERRRKYILTN